MQSGGEEDDSLANVLVAIALVPERVERLYSLLGEFCHALRNRLHILNLTLYLARRGGSFSPEEGSRMEDLSRKFEHLLEQVQWVCRPAELRPMRLDLGLLLDERRSSWTERL